MDALEDIALEFSAKATGERQACHFTGSQAALEQAARHLQQLMELLLQDNASPRDPLWMAQVSASTGEEEAPLAWVDPLGEPVEHSSAVRQLSQLQGDGTLPNLTLTGNHGCSALPMSAAEGTLPAISSTAAPCKESPGEGDSGAAESEQVVEQDMGGEALPDSEVAKEGSLELTMSPASWCSPSSANLELEGHFRAAVSESPKQPPGDRPLSAAAEHLQQLLWALQAALADSPDGTPRLAFVSLDSDRSR